MAADAALLDHPGGRIYFWTGPWVTLGKSQSPERALVDPDSISWVMRPTGGKAVLHGHDVTVGLGIPLVWLGLEGTRSVSAAYRAIVRPLVAAMREAGAPASLGEDTQFVKSGGPTADCFAHVAPNDIVHERTGQKLCGCALKLTQDAVLVQASIPNGLPLVAPHTVFAQPHESGSADIEAEMLQKALQRHLRAL